MYDVNYNSYHIRHNYVSYYFYHCVRSKGLLYECILLAIATFLVM